MTYERVHTVWDFYEGARSGIADYEGAPHHFINEFDEDTEDYTDKFFLRRIDDATFQLVTRQWKIWRKWELAFQSGQCDKTSHPALSGQDETYTQLGIEIKTEIDTLATQSIVANAVFRECVGQADLPAGVQRELEVEWTLCNANDRSNKSAAKRRAAP